MVRLTVVPVKIMAWSVGPAGPDKACFVGVDDELGPVAGAERQSRRPRANRPYSAFGVVAATDMRGCSSTVGRPAGPSTVR
jgi:hypothetical protein